MKVEIKTKGPARRRVRLVGAGMVLTILLPASARAQAVTLQTLSDQLLDLDGRVTAQGQAIGTLNGLVSTQSDALTTARQQVDATVQAVGALQTGVTAQGNALADLTGHVTANASAITSIDARILDNSSAVAAIDARVTTNATTTINQAAQIDANTNALLALDDRVTANGNALAQVQGDAIALRAQVAAGTIGIVGQQGPNAPITIGVDRGGAVVAINGTDGNRRISGVADGVAPDDAATMAQVGAASAQTLAASQHYTDAQVDAAASRTLAASEAYTDSRLAQTTRLLHRDMAALGARSAALAGLPQSIVPGDGLVGAALGGEGHAVALAAGLSKAFASPHTPILKAGASYDLRSGTVSYNAAVGIHF